MSALQQMTAEEFLALPDLPDEPPRSLVEGEVVVSDVLWRHAVVQKELLLALASWTRAEPGRGAVNFPVAVLLDERNVYVPDLLWYSERRAPALHAPRPYSVPDLAVEVRSPSTWRYDIGAKKSAYERHGLKELWLVDTAADELLAFRRSRAGGRAFDVALELGAGDTLTSPLLPGFALALDELFPPA